MAKQQTRRSVSLSCEMYLVASDHAETNNMTLAHLVDAALRAFGVIAPESAHVPRARAMKALAGRRTVAAATVLKRIGPIRRALGDGVANMLGEL